jgi:hypothetical protein
MELFTVRPLQQCAWNNQGYVPKEPDQFYVRVIATEKKRDLGCPAHLLVWQLRADFHLRGWPSALAMRILWAIK